MCCGTAGTQPAVTPFIETVSLIFLGETDGTLHVNGRAYGVKRGSKVTVNKQDAKALIAHGFCKVEVL